MAPRRVIPRAKVRSSIFIHPFKGRPYPLTLAPSAIESDIEMLNALLVAQREVRHRLMLEHTSASDSEGVAAELPPAHAHAYASPAGSPPPASPPAAAPQPQALPQQPVQQAGAAEQQLMVARLQALQALARTLAGHQLAAAMVQQQQQQQHAAAQQQAYSPTHLQQLQMQLAAMVQAQAAAQQHQHQQAQQHQQAIPLASPSCTFQHQQALLQQQLGAYALA
ncbi:hypothetical protein C2E20_2286 [Micractinium conductrix]|uniref:Uncharacterized protein n=1 Tax=Micractinium conductrix TaxID=554055 RepID=A0A2P6VKY6_9CHLO|nr:hypothetical protein C2E20_2286 [Micractinium conductrix]|eukprot:PSC74745.1 hypothetical protein C2E20_2286 [Micractinium conductrix]